MIEVEVYYDLGGPNCFTGSTDPRGYFLSARPVVHGGNFRRYTLFSGLKMLLHPANRFSQKVLDAVAAAATQHENYSKVIDAVCRKCGLVLAQPPTE